MQTQERVRVVEASPNGEPFTVRMLTLALGILQERALLWVSLLGGIGLFTWACAVPQWHRLAVAAAYAVLIWLPVLWKKGG